ncbi:sugar phosphate isomerase/epimerase family protein [Pollutimonas harenae]|uniref:TIM barrel protein n=1 Tax=Pollutimonas harenae TaxID=657015 RepID=A0A853H5R5_9BURK|nr:TIM barrel protein [Pollutimonas harenae]NYT86515.1 TIM barrel protein [Pollutimonas harenae]TEA69742.1 glutamine ABC transporter ATP-binding protein [Pollutimonas harenae]
MSSPQQVFVSLGSFGAAEVSRHGQNWFVRLCHDAGADGVEIRGELLTGADDELPMLAANVRGLGLACVYSSPDMLWDSQGKLVEKHLENGLSAARTLGSSVLKMSIGGFKPEASANTLRHLAACLAGQSVELLIENDQTETAGTLTALQRFFSSADEAGLKLGMTFDMGNWHWNGECPLQAAEAFSERVRYVHCKGVQRQPARWVAVPVVESAAPWRALLRAMPRSLPRAIEYPLAGDDLLSITRNAIRQLRSLETS